MLGFEIDHLFLNCKKELEEYGYKVGKISLKEQKSLLNAPNASIETTILLKIRRTLPTDLF